MYPNLLKHPLECAMAFENWYYLKLLDYKNWPTSYISTQCKQGRSDDSLHLEFRHFIKLLTM